MTIESQHKEWLQKLTGKAVLQESREQRRDKKAAVLSQLNAEIGRLTPRLFRDMNLTVSDESGQEQDVLSYGIRDQMLEFDLDEQQDGFTLRGDEDLIKHADASMIIGMLQDRLAKVMTKKIDPVTGEELDQDEPLFSDAEIADELYTPLVREGLLAETFVPDKYSETQKMIDASFGEYKMRLEAEGVEQKGFLAALTENHSTFVNVTKAVADVGAAVAYGLETVSGTEWYTPQAWDTLAEDGYAVNDGGAWLAKEIVDWTVIGLEGIDTALDAVDQAVSSDEDGPQEKPDLTRIKKAPMVAEFIISNICTAFGAAMDAAGLGVAAASSFSSVMKRKPLGDDLGAETLDEQKVKDAAAKLAEGFKKALLACDPKKPAAVETDNRSSTDILIAAGKKYADDFNNKIGATAGAIKTALEKNDKDVISKFVEAATAAFSDSATSAVLTKLRKAHGDDISATVNNTLTEELLEKQQECEQQEKEEMERIADQGDVQAWAGMLEKKIKKLERDKLTIDMAAKVGGLAFDVASKIISPLAIAGQLVKVVLNVTEAVKRNRDFYAWVDSRNDMLRAASAFSAPVRDFVHNADVQASHYEINAALEFIKMAGAIVECTGFGALIGKATQTAASIAGAVEAILYEKNQKNELETAWKMYKLALTQPENRKLALKAMKKNPTLAKYAVAWGAVIKKDPLVLDFMTTCGLDSYTLKDPNAKVGDVQKYLELRMPDDNVVVGRAVVSADWVPNIELSLASWTSVVKRGEAKAELVHQDLRDVELGLMRQDEFHAQKISGKNADSADQGDVVKYQELLDQIDGHFAQYSPKRLVDDEKNKKKKVEIRHVEMREVVENFRSHVQSRISETKQLVK